MELKKIFKLMFFICLVLIIIDQASKILVNNLVSKDIIIIPETLVITKVENEGIAFGINKQNLGNIGLCLIVLVLVFNFIIAQKEKMTKPVIIFFSLIVSGGISNIIDRIFKGAVFDFIKIGTFPVFNIADICIVLGWALFLISFLKDTIIDIKTLSSSKKDKTK